MPEGKTTAPLEKVFLGMDKVYEFSTRGNPGWSMDQKYSPYGSLLIIDSSNGIVWSAQDDDVGNFDSNVSLSVNLKDKIKTPGKYKIREVITLKKDGNEVKKLVHEFPVEVVDFKEFLGQSPKMPAGKTEIFLGTISQKSYPIKFSSHTLSQSMLDEGYKSIAKLQIYTVKDNRYVYGEKAYCEKGQTINYDLKKLPADAYYFVETIELRDKNNKVVQSAENMFALDWIPQNDISEVNISANWQGTIIAPVSETKGVKVTAICPAGIATDLYGLSPELQRFGLKVGVLMSPESCARRGLKAMFKGRRCVVPDWWFRLFIPICQCLCGAPMRWLRNFTMKFQK